MYVFMYVPHIFSGATEIPRKEKKTFWTLHTDYSTDSFCLTKPSIAEEEWEGKAK